MAKKIYMAIAFLTGLGLIFIGARFLIAPETAELGYGIHFNEQGDYSFHYIKGIRDLFSGFLICILALSKQTKALGIALLIGTIIPIVDLVIVLSKDYTGLSLAAPHISAIIVCFVFGLALLFNRKKQIVTNNSYARIIKSSSTDKESIIEFNIVPNEKTPWHYHTLFSESFEILNGTLEVGLNNQIQQLKKGDIVNINPNEKHCFRNISDEDCLIKVTLNPGNKNFENSLLILKGLTKDGLTSSAGTPKNISDLVLFVYLNNSKMVGFQKIAEPIFKYLAKRAIKNGYLKKLELKYCEE